jgi:hypothetical protein
MSLVMPYRVYETEDAFEDALIQMAKALGWTAHASRRARTKRGWVTAIKGPPGFPDLVLAKPEHPIIFAELKLDHKKLETVQWLWARLLLSAAPGIEYYVWRPCQWDQIEARLRRS